MVDLPSFGQKIPVDQFHISECNVRHGEPFGVTQEDQEFKEHLKFNQIRVPMEARPEKEGYGIYIGRRRFFGKKDFTEGFVIGKDVIINDISEEEAREASFIENNEWLKKNMDPITYAEQLNKVSGNQSIRSTAKRLNIGASTLSEYLTLLKGLTSTKMRNILRTGIIPYKGRSSTDPYSALSLAKLELSKEKLDELAQVLETEGVEEFWKQVQPYQQHKKSRGLPKGEYDVFRVTWNKSNDYDKKYSQAITQASKAQNKTEPEYIKLFLIKHMKEIEKDAQQ